jgi:hypothetical protein
MGLNRFSTVGQSEYTAQHVPLPFDTISKLGEQVKLEHDTADAAASAAKTDIQGGLATQEHAKALNARKNALLAEAQARAEKTNNYGRLTQDIKEIASTIQNDPLYQGIQRDIAMTKLVNQQRMDPNHPYVMQNYADEKGNVKQLSTDQPFDESYYSMVAPGNRNTERKPLFDQMKPIISRIYNQPVTKTWEDENGKIHTQTLQEGVEAEGLRRAQVKNIMANYIRQDRNALNTQSYMYDKARMQKQGLDWTLEDELEASANAFMGEFYNEREIQKLGADKITGESAAAAKARAVAEAKAKADEEVPNQFVLMVDAKKTAVDAPVLKHLGYAEGPKDVPGSYMVNLDGTDGQAAIVNFAKVTPDNPQANNIVTFGNALNNIKKTTGIENNETFLTRLQSQNPENLYRIVGGNIEILNLKKHPGLKLTQEQYQNQAGEIITAKDASVPIDIFKESYIKTTDEYKILEDEAKENGVNISDPTFKSNYLKTLGVKTIKEAEDMGQMLNIKGDYPFILKDGNNKTNVGDKAFLDGYIILTKDQIDAEMANKGLESNVGLTINPMSLFTDDWEELFLTSNGGNGMVEPYARTRDGVEQFKIPIKKPIQVSQVANQNYNSSFYGASVTGKEAQNQAEKFNDWQAKGITAREDKVYGQSYTNNPTGFKNNIIAAISSNRALDSDTKGQLFKIVEDLKKDPNASKEAWISFKRAINTQDPKVLIEQYNNYLLGVTPQPNLPGKSTGGWSQTPATPR